MLPEAFNYMKRLLTFFLLTLIVFSFSTRVYTEDQPSKMPAEYEVIHKKSEIINESHHEQSNVTSKKQDIIHESHHAQPEVISKKQEIINKTQGVESEVIQKKQLNNIYQLLEPAKKTIMKTKEQTLEKGLLKPAWQYFNEGNYNQAIEIFTEILAYPDTEQEAKYGIAMCYIKLKDPEKAVPPLESLVESDYDLKNTLLPLLTALVDIKEYKRAETYLSKLPEHEKSKWEQIIKTKALYSDLDSFKNADNIDDIIELTKNNSGLLKKCRLPGFFYEAAGAIVKTNNEYAIDIYKTILASCRAEKDLRLGILYSLKSILSSEEMLLVLDSEKNRHIDSVYDKKVSDMKISIMLDKFYALPDDSPDREAEAKKILSLEPQESGVRLMMAWWYLNNKDYKHAYNEFNALYKRSPQEKDYLYGLVLSLIKLKRYDEALGLASKHKDTNFEVFILSEKLASLPADSPEADVVVQRMLALKPEEQSVRLTLAWYFLNSKNYDQAYNEFSALYKSNPLEKDYSYGMVLSLINLKRYDEALELISKHKETDVRLAALEINIKVAILGEKLDALPPDSPEIEDTARQILALNPDEDGIRVMLAWNFFSNDKYDKAYKEFHIVFQRNPELKDSVFGMALSLQKLERGNEALELAVMYRDKDERFVPMVKDLCMYLANITYKDGKYKEAEGYYERALAEDPDDLEVKRLLELSIFKQTFISRVLSPFEGLPGDSFGKIVQDLDGGAGISLSFYVNQGIDWVKLPGGIILNTYGEYRYSTRSNQSLYFNESGEALGITLKKSIFKLGLEYYWQSFPDQNANYLTTNTYLAWYQDWSKYVRSRADESWFSIDGFSGETYGKITYDLNDPVNGSGFGFSGFTNEGIDWLTLPGEITLNTHAEFRYGFRTNNNYYNNSFGPALVIELQKLPFKLGMEYYWDRYTEQNITQQSWTVYLLWHYYWDLKSKD